jgi:hypothetical protein
MVCAPALPADVVWDWSYDGNQYSGSGTFDTESTLTTGLSGFTGYRILSISGTWDGTGINDLLPPFGYASNDNLLALSTPQLSLNGVAFETSDGFFDIHYTGSLNNYKVENPVLDDNGQGTFAATVETPEPTTTVLMGSALLVLGLLVRHQRRNQGADQRSLPVAARNGVR